MHKLAVNGIDEQVASLAQCSSYVFIANSEEQGIDYALSSFSANNHTFILSEDIERFYKKDVTELFGWSWSDLADSSLAFRINKELLSERDGAEQLLTELNFYKQADGAHFIIHLSEDILVNVDITQLEALLSTLDNFAKRKNATVFWLLTGEAAIQLRDTLRTLTHIVAGLAIVETEAASQRLFFDFWRQQAGYTANVAFNVVSSAPLSVAKQEKQEAGHLQQFSDQNQVLICAHLVPSNTKLPPNYTIYANNDEIFKTAMALKAATVILAIDKTSDLLHLGEQCLALRKAAGSWLKIVLKNTDGVIRHKDECVFLTVGVNLILHSATDISRVMSQVQAIQGFQFARALPNSFDDVVNHAQGSLKKGYLSVFNFIDEVMKQRESSLNTGVSGVLVVLKLQKGLQPEHVLSLFKIKRGGDILTATDKNIYLYLHACRENDVDLALERLFRLSLGEFFLYHDIYSSELMIDDQCRELRKLAMKSDVVDYEEKIDSSNVAQLSADTSRVRPASSSEISLNFNRSAATPITIKLKG